MRLALLALVVCACLAFAGPAVANTFNVTTTTDNVGTCAPGDCSLREAVDAANANAGADTIDVPAGDYILTSGQLAISDDVDIAGASARSTIVDGGGNSRVFEVDSGTTHMSHLTITGGLADQGAGIFNESILFLDNVAVDNNRAFQPAAFFGAQGGGIFNNNTMTVTNSTISHNVADGTGAADTGGQGGGVFNNDQGDFTNVTISDNEAKPTGNSAQFPDGQGGGVFVNDVTTFTNSTIAGNVSSGAPNNAAGGVFLNDQTTFTNTIVAGNTVGGAENDCVVNTPTIHDGGHNLEGANDCGLTGAADLHNTDPLMGALANNGGDTDTRALQSSSPAIDAADATACPATDQRGVSRPQGAGCDIGAFELEAAQPSPSPTPGPTPSAKKKDTKGPRVVVAGVRVACISRSFSIRVRTSDASGVRSTRVTLDGKRLRTTKATEFTLRINVAKLKPGRHTLRIVTTDKAGNKTTKTRTITRCAEPAAKPRHVVSPRFTG